MRTLVRRCVSVIGRTPAAINRRLNSILGYELSDMDKWALKLGEVK